MDEGIRLRVIFFCENSVMTRQFLKLIETTPDGIEPVFISADFGRTTHEWVERSLQSSGQRCHNIADGITPHRSRHARSYLFAFAQFFQKLLSNGPPSVFVFTNDTSVRGEAASRAAHAFGVPRLLLQQGWLDFVGHRTLPTDSWGRTNPEVIGVYGARRAEAIRASSFFRRMSSVFVSGNFEIESSKPASRQSSKDKSLPCLLIDQPFSSQGQLSFEDELQLFRESIGYLSSHFSSIEFLIHPSRPNDVKRRLTEGLVLDGVLEASSLKWSELSNYSACATFFSSVAAISLNAGIRTIILDSTRLGRRLPSIATKHITYVDHEKSVDQRGMVLSHREEGGEPLSHYCEPFHASDVWDAVVGPLSHKAWSLSSSTRPPYVANQGAKLAVLSKFFSSETGVARPLRAALPRLASNYSETSLYSIANVGALQESLEGTNRLILNSFSIIDILSARQINALGAFARTNQGRIVFTPHETWWTILVAASSRPRRFLRFCQDVLPYVKVLCLTEFQKEICKTLGGRHFSVIGNGHIQASELLARHDEQLVAPQSPNVNTAGPIVLGVGSIQARKGADLFGEIAEMAAIKGYDYRFVWAGMKTVDAVRESEMVTWLGHLPEEDVLRLMSEAAVLLLPARDDPLPLVVTEAWSVGTQVIVGPGNGWAATINRLGGGVATRRHSTKDYLNAVESVISGKSQGIAPALLSHFASSERYAQLILNSLETEVVYTKSRLSSMDRLRSAAMLALLIVRALTRDPKRLRLVRSRQLRRASGRLRKYRKYPPSQVIRKLRAER